MATVIRIRCDWCSTDHPNEWKNSGQAINYTVRPAIARDGWQSISTRSLDYCPACVKAGKVPKQRAKVK